MLVRLPCAPLIPALFASLLGMGVVRGEECIKSVRWYDDPPYTVRLADGSIGGLNVELAREALRRMGCSMNLVEMPWARALLELEHGRLDILPGALRSEERERYAYFSQPTNRSPNVLFLSKQAANRYPIGELADIVGTEFRLGTQIKVNYGPVYMQLQQNPAFLARLVPITQRRGAWKMLQLGRLDGMIADEVTALMELRQLGLSEAVVKTQVVTADEPAMFAFSKQRINADFVDHFNQALEAMKANGSYQDILNRTLPCKASIKNLGCE
ncbi:transporter substrate-binding domain-containing protein [Chitinimonas sp.]|uniref:substrate-binding periplasmic protein n=1 Tax=Chitinimonas sp. TaxID=1934313 RepID=UPI002F922B96